VNDLVKPNQTFILSQYIFLTLPVTALELIIIFSRKNSVGRERILDPLPSLYSPKIFEERTEG
jgi:hypothetical protein